MEYQISELSHDYPSQVHILNNGYINTLLTTASQSKTVQPHFNNLMRSIYRELFGQALNKVWPTKEVQVPTRMTEFHTDCFYKGQVFDSHQKAVCVDIARAGMLPSQICFDTLNEFADPQGIRHDHVFASRIVDENDKVTHTSLQSSKIGGDVDEALVFLADPMGATGNSLVEVIDHYKKNVEGSAKAYIGIHLIVTPEFVKKVTEAHSDVIIFAARLDRGFSSEKALSSQPGKFWDEEKGLNEKHYIVPGAGGVGELINNSFV